MRRSAAKTAAPRECSKLVNEKRSFHQDVRVIVHIRLNEVVVEEVKKILSSAFAHCLVCG